jgi:two-component system nitrate/nitrite sensor histidine kinase NarX
LRRRAVGSPLEPELEKIQRNLHHEALSVRELMREIRPPDLDARQLLDFLALCVEKFQNETGITARFVTSLEELNLPPRVCTELARIVQEGLANIRKHSRAQNVLVRFGSADGCWRLLIDDDGRGFDFSGRLSHAELEAEHRGPVVIRERVRAIGGELTIESHPGRGARLEVTLPQRHGG